jgi:glycosyltransferase involved in cell wall biosynthesis
MTTDVVRGRNRKASGPLPTISSRGAWLPRRRSVRLLALLAARNEMRFLPGYVLNVGRQVDGIIALDDGSTDGSARFLELHPQVLELIRVPAERPEWDEIGNYRTLVAAALEKGADWLISLDADERLERGFRRRAERVIRRGERRGLSGYTIRLLELWNSPELYRADGIWGSKAPPRLFRARHDHGFDQRRLHSGKVPLQAGRNGCFPHADLNVYHLRMIRPEDRLARRRRYELADPEARFQPSIGYAYLTDERGALLRRIPRGRGYERRSLRRPLSPSDVSPPTYASTAGPSRGAA